MIHFITYINIPGHEHTGLYIYIYIYICMGMRVYTYRHVDRALATMNGFPVYARLRLDGPSMCVECLLRAPAALRAGQTPIPNANDATRQPRHIIRKGPAWNLDRGPRTLTHHTQMSWETDALACATVPEPLSLL
jgi:hypothetical protein